MFIQDSSRIEAGYKHPVKQEASTFFNLTKGY